MWLCNGTRLLIPISRRSNCREHHYHDYHDYHYHSQSCSGSSNNFFYDGGQRRLPICRPMQILSATCIICLVMLSKPVILSICHDLTYHTALRRALFLCSLVKHLSMANRMISHIHIFQFPSVVTCNVVVVCRNLGSMVCILILIWLPSCGLSIVLSIHSVEGFDLFALCTFNARLTDMRPNFTLCAEVFANFSANNSTYNFTGKHYGILSNPTRIPSLITYKGCKALCGPGSEYYSWASISTIITTWVMVIVNGSNCTH